MSAAADDTQCLMSARN